MNILNMTEEDIKSTLRIVSAVLHFGNMEFKKERGNDQATMPDNTVAQKVCQLLRLDINNFTRALLRPKIKVIISLFYSPLYKQNTYGMSVKYVQYVVSTGIVNHDFRSVVNMSQKLNQKMKLISLLKPFQRPFTRSSSNGS